MGWNVIWEMLKGVHGTKCDQNTLYKTQEINKRY